MAWLAQSQEPNTGSVAPSSAGKLVNWEPAHGAVLFGTEEATWAAG